MGVQADWLFTNRVTQNRQKALLIPRDFGCIVGRIVNGSQNISVKVCYGKHLSVRSCRRVEFTFKVDQDTFDLFFNSPFGYRGHYYKGVPDGERANKSLISALSPKLLHHVDGHPELDWIRRSLAGASAKIWINEEGIRKQQKNLDLIIEINVQRWVAAAKRFHTDNVKYLTHSKALEGVRAYTGHWLDVKGGFVDGAGEERVAEDKEGRSQQIEQYGFT